MKSAAYLKARTICEFFEVVQKDTPWENTEGLKEPKPFALRPALRDKH